MTAFLLSGVTSGMKKTFPGIGKVQVRNRDYSVNRGVE